MKTWIFSASVYTGKSRNLIQIFNSYELPKPSNNFLETKKLALFSFDKK